MFLKFVVPAALLLAAAPIAAQPPATPPTPPPDPLEAQIQTTAVEFGQCISTGLKAVSDSIAPEAAATAILNGCAAQRSALVKAVEAVLATLPADQKAEQQKEFDTKLGEAPAQIAAAIRQHRADAAAAAPAKPGAPATPPH